jgi:hypothetical protein
MRKCKEIPDNKYGKEKAAGEFYAAADKAGGALKIRP